MGWKDWLGGDEGWIPDSFTGGKPTRQALFGDSLVGEIEGNNKAMGPPEPPRNSMVNAAREAGVDMVREGTSNYYDDIKRAETGGRADPWLRTEVYGSGSSAYGPAQLTGTTAKHYRDEAGIDWSDDEMDYLNRFGEQADMFLDVGGSDMEKALKERSLVGDEAENFIWNYLKKNDIFIDIGANVGTTTLEAS